MYNCSYNTPISDLWIWQKLLHIKCRHRFIKLCLSRFFKVTCAKYIEYVEEAVFILYTAFYSLSTYNSTID